MDIKQQINLIKRWYGMVCGKSVFHVKQNIGKVCNKETLEGYYNDLTGKVTGNTSLDEHGIPINITASGKFVYFPITIFQYALGAYDMYLLTKDNMYKEKFFNIVEWALENQNEDGSWNCFDKLGDRIHKPFSAMCQGEGASVLSRAYIESREERYYSSAIKAVDFMLIDVNDGGTTQYENGYTVLQEYVSENNSSVLNGWIFAIFGLLDITKISSNEFYKNELDKTINSLKEMLTKYDRGYWSSYDLQGTIASPAYHDLHIQQLRILYYLFEVDEYNEVANKWEKYAQNKFSILKAYIYKAIQKLFFSKYDNGTSLIK